MVTDGWWNLSQGMTSYGVTPSHQNPRSTMAEKRVFTQQPTDVWDLRDNVLELHENEHRLESNLRLNQTGDVNFEHFSQHFSTEEINDWLSSDTRNGFIRVFPPDSNRIFKSRLVACNTQTPVHVICRELGVGETAMHIQLNGDRIRRLESHEQPLCLQNDFLISLGHSNIVRVQKEGLHEDLHYLIMFHAGLYEGGRVLCNGVGLCGFKVVVSVLFFFQFHTISSYPYIPDQPIKH